jgi:hypothetical protein
VKVLRPFQPLITLVALTILLIALVTLTRLISARAGFLVERQIVLLVWLAGLLIASAAFAWFVRRVVRRDVSRSGLLFMVLTVLLLAAPLSLSLLQHPAP